MSWCPVTLISNGSEDLYWVADVCLLPGLRSCSPASLFPSLWCPRVIFLAGTMAPHASSGWRLFTRCLTCPQRRQWHPHSSTLAWEMPWMEEPGRLQSMRLQSRTRLSDFTFTFPFHALEKEIATHSSVLSWRIPGTGEPGGLPSMGSHRVGHDWRDLAAAAPAPFIMSPSTGILMLDCALPSLNVIVFPVYFLPRSHVCALAGHVPPPLDASLKSACFWRCVLNADFPIKPSLMAQLKESCLLCVSLELDQRWLFLGEACGSNTVSHVWLPVPLLQSLSTPLSLAHLHPLDGWFAQNHSGKF